MKTAETEISN